MSHAVARLSPVRPLVLPAAAASLALVMAGTGIVAPIVPLLGVIALAVLLAAPMRWTAMAMLGVVLVADNPGERPMEGKWASPLLPLGDLLYQNLHKHTGIEALRFSALELLLSLLMAIVVLRKVRKDPIDDPLSLGALPNPMKHAFAGLFAAIVWLEVYGLARGGDFKNSLWQVRQMFWLPVLGVLFGHAFKNAEARAGLLRTLLAVAFVRCLVGIYFTYAIARPQGLQLEYVMTHSDSVLIVVAILIGAAMLAERPTVGHLAMNLVLQPVLGLGLIVNDRRVAFVSLAAGMLTLVLMGPDALRRLIRCGLVALIPLGLLYVAAGWNASSAIFKPVQTLRSVSSSEDASSQTRNIENYNLTLTLKRHPFLGSGFGHEYYEFVQANRVDQVFAQYRYIAHNSVLWLLSLSGWLGFAVLWTVFPVSVLVARRVHRLSVSAVDRTTAFAAVAAVLCFIVQAWADMGLQSWMGAFVLASLTGATGAMWTARTRPEAYA